MKRNLFKLPLMALLFFAIIFLQNCANQEAIQPQPNTEQVTSAPNVLQKIKTLGFTDDQIKEMPDYYLVDGDLYFPKKESLKKESSVKKPGQPLHEKYFTLTIRVDESVSGDMDSRWLEGLDQAITEWNSNQDVHFHFSLTTAVDANISIVKDNGLPSDVAVASEFPEEGRTGSSIHLNFTGTKATENPKQTLLHAIKHCVGHRHSDLTDNSKSTRSVQISKNARGPRWDNELYAIQGDGLYRINGQTGEFFLVSRGWAGTTAMGQLNGALYMTQFGCLIGVNPGSGFRYPLTTGWEGATSITRLYDLPAKTTTIKFFPKLFIMCDQYIYPVNPDDGTRDNPLGGKQWVRERGLVGFTEPLRYDGTLAVAQDPGWPIGRVRTTVTAMDRNGHILYSFVQPGSNLTGWNGYRELVDSNGLMLFNGTLNWLGDHLALPVSSEGTFLNVTKAFGMGNEIYFIDNGTLFILTPNGHYQVAQRGLTGEWVDTHHLLRLDPAF